MIEAIAHEVGAQRQPHGILADDGFERVQNGRRLAVGDAAVAVAGENFQAQRVMGS